jgi:hypothetical protein
MVERLYDIGAHELIFVRFKVDVHDDGLVVYKVEASWNRHRHGEPPMPPITVMIATAEGPWLTWHSTWSGIYPVQMEVDNEQPEIREGPTPWAG